MLGVLWRCDGGSVRLERTVLGGLRVIRALVPAGGRQARRVARAARLLAKAGVRRVLENRDFDAGETLGRCGLRYVDAGILYRHMAPELTLARLAQLGMEPGSTVVVLRGRQVSGELARAAERLCPKVRGVLIQAGPGSARLQQRLYARYGMAVDGLWRGNVMAVRFDGPDGDEALRLQPLAEGLRLEAGDLIVPPELDEASYLCALWLAGGIKEDQLRVLANKTS